MHTFTTFLSRFIPGVVVLIACGLLPASTLAQWTQQGNKLVGTGSVGQAQQGSTVALSGDGNTAAVAAIYDNGQIGAVWVYTRTGNVWSQQGSKIVGTGIVGSTAEFGRGLALSADGNTLACGADLDSTNTGAIWVFTRTGGVWSQQGSKLTVTGAVGQAFLGLSVALSSDGNTMIAGGVGDNSSAGAAWVFTRTGGVWSQQGSKLVGTGAVGNANQGLSVALSSDGNTAIVGGYLDANQVGAAWVFTRSAGVWSQQGNKLVGTGYVQFPTQGRSVALSADGNTACVGGNGDNAARGAVWMFTRTGGVWAQQGNKLVGTGAVGNAQQGWSVALSADGNTLVESGIVDNGLSGALWSFKRTAGVWSQQGTKFLGTGNVGNAWQGYSVSMSSNATTLLEGGIADASSTGAAWVFTAPGTAVREIEGLGIPQAFALEQNYPNPFNPSTEIRFTISGAGFVSLRVFDVLGREVATLANQTLQPGGFSATWDAAHAPSGTYFYRLQSGDLSETRKMVLTK